jgi:hypothetical protein
MESLEIRRVGKRLGLVFPPKLVRQFGLAEKSVIVLRELPNGAYELAPTSSEAGIRAERIMNRYKNTLRDLSK